jgi:hypothetical protein
MVFDDAGTLNGYGAAVSHAAFCWATASAGMTTFHCGLLVPCVSQGIEQSSAFQMGVPLGQMIVGVDGVPCEGRDQIMRCVKQATSAAGGATEVMFTFRKPERQREPRKPSYQHKTYREYSSASGHEYTPSSGSSRSRGGGGGGGGGFGSYDAREQPGYRGLPSTDTEAALQRARAMAATAGGLAMAGASVIGAASRCYTVPSAVPVCGGLCAQPVVLAGGL